MLSGQREIEIKRSCWAGEIECLVSVFVKPCVPVCYQKNEFGDRSIEDCDKGDIGVYFSGSLPYAE